MSDRGRRLYTIQVSFYPDGTRWSIRANSEEEAIERFREDYAHEIIHNWVRYGVEEVEDEE